MRNFSRLFRAALVAVSVHALGASCAHAQDAAAEANSASESTSATVDGEASTPATAVHLPATPSPASRSDRPGELGSAGPEVYWLPDEQGRLRRFLNFTYEDFQRAMRAAIDAHGTDSLPKFRIDSVSIRAEETTDGLSCEVAIDITLNGEGWVAAPLGFGELIGDGGATIVGGDDLQHVIYDSDLPAYVARIRGAPGERRRVELHGYMSTTVDGGRRSISINGPVAPTNVELTVPFASVDATASQGQRLTVREVDHASSAIQLTGRGGLIEFSWSPQDADFEQPAVLDAEGLVSVALEAGVLHYDATFTVRGPGSPLERLLVRLPPGASLVESRETTAYQATVAKRADQRQDDPGQARQLVEVRFNGSDATTATFRLLADAVVDDLQEPTTTEIAAFNVLGAMRQRGFLTLRISRNLHSYYDTVGAIELVSEKSLPSGADRSIDASFAYSSSKCAIRVHTQPRVRNVRVRPRHALRVFSTHTELTSEFEYQITGGRTNDLRVALNGWTLTDEPIDSQDAVDLAETHVTRSGQLVMPLKDPDAQQVRVSFSLRRDTSLGSNDFPFPAALFAQTLPGTIVLRGDSGVEVRADVEASTGLGSFSSLPVEALGGADEASIGRLSDQDDSVSLQTFLNDPVLTVHVAERERPLQVQSTVAVIFRASEVAVEQSFVLEGGGAPTSLKIALPSELVELWAFDQLKVMYDGRPVESSRAVLLEGDAPVDGAAAGGRTLSISPATSLRESAAIQLEYSVPRLNSNFSDDKDELFTAPVARALDCQQSTDAIVQTEVEGAVRIARGADDEAWQIETPTERGVPTRLVAAGPVAELPLALSTAIDANSVVLTRAWAQSWLSGSVRQDRFVFRVSVEGDEFPMELPKDWDLETIETKVDGVPVELRNRANGTTALQLPRSVGTSLHTIELRRQFTQRLGVWNRVVLQWPIIQSKGASRLVYWHIVTPGNVVLCTQSAELFGEHRSGWDGMRWGRRPVRDQTQLENWASAERTSLPPASANQFLYSSFGVPLVCEATVARSAWLGIVASTACFLMVLGAGYQLGRIAAFWILALIAAFATFLLRPDLAIFLFQALMGGGVLLLAASLLRRLLLDRADRALPFAVPTDSTAEYDAPTRILIGEGSRAGDLSSVELTESLPAGESP